MTIAELLKAKGIDEETIKTIQDEMKANKLFIASEENLDIRYGKLKTDHDALVSKHAESEKLISDLLNKGFDLGKGKDRVRYINYRIYINTIKKSFDLVAQSEKNARFYQEDCGDMVEIRIQIPKSEGASLCKNM